MNHLVLHLITALDEGGAENILARYVTASSPSCKHVVVSIKRAGVVAEKLLLKNVSVYSLNISKNPFSVIKGLQRWLTIIFELKPSIIHSWLYHANLLASMTKFFYNCHQVWGIHNSNLYRAQDLNPTYLISRFLGLLARYQSPYIVYCAESASHFHIQQLGYPNTTKSCVIVNGVRDYFKNISQLPDENSSLVFNNNSTKVFGCIARFHRVKNHALLMSAFALALEKNENIRLVLVGNGVDAENEHLNFLVDTLDIRHSVSFLGHRNDIDELITSFDFLVLSSRSEAFPSVLIESMMLGIPCISTDVGDAAAIIDDTGWICPSLRSDDLARCIISAAALDSERYLELSKSSSERASSLFSLNLMVERYDNLYREILR